MSFVDEYRQKLVSADEAVKVVKSGDWVDYGMTLSVPYDLDIALAKRKDELKDIKVRGLLAPRPLQIVEQDKEGSVFTYDSWHFSGYERSNQTNNVYFTPHLYRNKPLHYRKSLTVDVAMMMVAPMDDKGYFSFSLTNSASKAILETAKIVILEVNEKLPRTCGLSEDAIHISEVDYIVEGSNLDIPTIPKAPVTDVDRKIAELIVPEIPNGAVLQLGIGGLPNYIGEALANSDIKDLGVHTEMLVDAYLDLEKAGKLTNNSKNIDKGRGVWAFCMGSQELYDWVRENPASASAPVNYTNSPYVIAQNDNVISVNNCIEIDLFGQVCAESSGTRQISGTGGQLDFVTGAYMSNGGKSFICLSSSFTDKKTGELKSRIVPTLPLGGIVSVPRSQVHYIATEYGVVNLAGRSTWEMAEALISIAHPQFRDALVKQAEAVNIWRKSNKR